ncbi:hypothetical protein YC2023_116651 [Brassica napus]
MEVEEEERVRGRRMICGPTELSLVKVVLWAMIKIWEFLWRIQHICRFEKK